MIILILMSLYSTVAELRSGNGYEESVSIKKNENLAKFEKPKTIQLAAARLHFYLDKSERFLRNLDCIFLIQNIRISAEYHEILRITFWVLRLSFISFSLQKQLALA